jgi:hypothetical protein
MNRHLNRRSLNLAALTLAAALAAPGLAWASEPINPALQKTVDDYKAQLLKWAAVQLQRRPARHEPGEVDRTV